MKEDHFPDAEILTGGYSWVPGWDLPPCFGCGSVDCTVSCDRKRDALVDVGVIQRPEEYSQEVEREEEECGLFYCEEHIHDHECGKVEIDY
jgi:hypothetical protein